MRLMTSDEFKKCELDALKKIDSICLDNGFRYYLAFGTLLGAVRHKGFIPWDDDVDVWLPRPDYEKFLHFCINNEETIYPYKIAHYSNNSSYCMAMARFFDQRTKVVENHVRECGLGVFIDIYPLDGCGNTEEESLKVFLKNKARRFLVGIGAPSTFEASHNGAVKNIVKYLCYKYANMRGISKLLYQMDMESMKHKYVEEKYIASTVWAIYRRGKGKSGWIGTSNSVDIFKKEWFDKSMRMQFEDAEVSIPWKYDEILTNRYGDYMSLPPVSEQKGHHDTMAYFKGNEEL